MTARADADAAQAAVPISQTLSQAMSQAASCPRCGQGFHCGVNDSQPCACGGVKLDGPLRAVLRQRYSSCLCGDCLRALVGQSIQVG